MARKPEPPQGEPIRLLPHQFSQDPTTQRAIRQTMAKQHVESERATKD